MASIDGITLRAETSEAEKALARLEAEVIGPPPPKTNLESRGPRNLPKPSMRKRRRQITRASRRANR